MKREAYAGMEVHSSTDKRLMREGMGCRGKLPQIGSIILVNELIHVRDNHNRLKSRSYRGVVYVKGFTENGLVICEEIYSKTYHHVICF